MRSRQATFWKSLLTLGIICGMAHAATAADWPAWGGNAARSAAATGELPEQLHLNWTLNLRTPDPAWHSNQDRVQFDRMYEPVVAGKRMFVGSMVSDRVTAYDIDTGRELWRFFTEGPVRLAPTVWNEKVYVACDDGYLYCLAAVDGSLLWKFCGGPMERKILGNDRLISIYPARGAPVVYDGTVYFAAGIWPFMGTFIHALDAETGEVIWTNSGTGSMYILQQHDRPAFAGIAPQGYLVATEDILLVSGGQTVPAAFNRHTGEFVHFNVNSREMGEKGGSGYHVRATEEFFVTNEYMFRMSDGAYLARIDYPVITDQSLISIDPSGTLRAFEHAMHIERTKDRKGRDTVKATLKLRWTEPLEMKLERVHLVAGSRAIATGPNGLIAAIDFSERSGEPRITWTTQVEGDPLSVITADGKLFVSTDTGRIACFAGAPPASGSPEVIAEPGEASTAVATGNDQWQNRVEAILSETGVTEGYCLLLGIGSGRMLDELLAQSELHVIALDPDRQTVEEHRRRLDAARMYGTRCEIFTGDIFSIQLPPYLAELIVAEDPVAAGLDQGDELVSRMFETLRPYGGVACLPVAREHEEPFAQFAAEGNSHNAQLKRSEDDSLLLLSREGALPGSAPWTHQYADAGNSVMSKDELVKLPLGILWFGGPSNEKVLPRHGHGPTPQVAGGRLFIEGRDMLRAVDVYTGRLLWERDFPDVGQYYDYTSHEPGANAIGSNYVSLEDSVYLIDKHTCYRLDARTGRTLGEFQVSAATGEQGPPEWGYLSVTGDTLIGGIQPVHFKSHVFNYREMRRHDGEEGASLLAEIRKWKDFEVEEPRQNESLPVVLIENLNRALFSANFLAMIPQEIREKAAATDLEQELQQYLAGGDDREGEPRAVELKRRLLERYYDLPVYEDRPIGMYGNWSRRASRRLVGLDRVTGQERWSVSARYSFRHNAIAVGGGTVFALDRLQDAEVEHLRRRGLPVDDDRRIIAVDLDTGEEIWSDERRIFGTWLGYSEEYDVLVQAGSASGDRALDEVGAGIVAYRGSDGTVLWESDVRYSGPLMIHNDTLYSQPGPGHAFDLLTGQIRMRPHPLSGEMVAWTYSRDGGCNTAICSQHLITFRSSAAGFFDLAGDSGTGNWGGFRSSCTSNLIPADGILNAPDYTRTCTCTFQNRSSLALVHMPEIETWTFNRFDWDGRRVQQLGLNLGAPGDRRAPSGLLWLDFPSVGGDSPDVPVSVIGDEVDYFRYHSSHVDGPSDWVASCGVTGASEITITLDRDEAAPPRNYTVRLVFAETEELEPGERVFDVHLQDAPVLTNFDIRAEAGEANRSLIKEFRTVAAGHTLQIQLSPKTGRTLLCGIELLAEGE